MRTATCLALALAWVLAFSRSQAEQRLMPNELERPGVSPTLKIGDKKPEVKLLQARLARISGEKVDIDGAFGPATLQALKAFQEASGLQPDGVVGNEAWQKLYDIEVGNNAYVTAYALQLVRDLLDDAEIKSAMITSGYRRPSDQARIMYDNIVKTGVRAQLDLYGDNGDLVIQVYKANQEKSRADVIALLEKEIGRIGPGNVSKHMQPDHDTIDVSPISLGDRQRQDRFEEALKAAKKAGRISHFILPGNGEPAFHVERKISVQ
jgi:peptidoglycan hydrolase-like protein with peptidoglycan-binding domain